MTAILHCDMCPELNKKATSINTREWGIYSDKQLKAKTGWTAHEGGVHICKECNELYSILDKLKEGAAVEKLDRAVKVKDTIKLDTEPSPTIEILDQCDIGGCDFESTKHQVERHKQAYHYAELEVKEREIVVFKCPLCVYVSRNKNNTQSHVNNQHIKEVKYLDTTFIEDRMTIADYDKMRADYDKFSLFVCKEGGCNFLTLDQYLLTTHRRVEHGITTGRLPKIRVSEENYLTLLNMDMIQIELRDFTKQIYPVYECKETGCKFVASKYDYNAKLNAKSKQQMNIHMNSVHHKTVDVYHESFRTRWIKKIRKE